MNQHIQQTDKTVIFINANKWKNPSNNTKRKKNEGRFSISRDTIRFMCNNVLCTIRFSYGVCHLLWPEYHLLACNVHTRLLDLSLVL